MQEGMIALLAAVRSYRADGGASFRTYASRCIANGLGHVAESHCGPATSIGAAGPAGGGR